MRFKKREAGTKGNTNALLRGRTWGAVAALLAAVIVYGVMVQTERNILSKYEKGTVYTAIRGIPKGTTVTEANRSVYFGQKQLDKTCIPQRALTDAQPITEWVALYNIDADTILTGGMFEEKNEVLAEMESPVIAGFKADDLYQVVGGMLRTGDRIHVYSVQEEGTVQIWAKAYVYQVFDSSGALIEAGDKKTTAQRINIYLDAKDVPGFYDALARGSLRAAKICGQQESE